MANETKLSVEDKEVTDFKVTTTDVDDTVAVESVDSDEGPILDKKLIRKIDFHLIPPLALLYVGAYIDRSALANASIFTYKADIGISSNQYNLIVTIFYISYWFWEYPSQMIMPYCRPNWWLGGIAFGWGVVTVLNGFTKSFGGAVAARFFMGVFEAGYFPGAMYYLGLWYPRRYLASRIACYYVVGVFAGSWGGLLAYAIAHMEGVANLAAWRWLFILEGLGTCVAAGILVLTVPNHPDKCKWLTAEEKEICMAQRKAAGNLATHFEMRYFKLAVKDYKVWFAAWLVSAGDIAVYGFSYTLPTILVQMGYKAATAQLMTMPFYAVSALGVVCASFLSDRIGMRGPIILFGYGMTFIGLIVCYCLPKESMTGVRYFFSMWILVGVYTCFPSLLSWCSNNAAGSGKRNMAMTISLSTGNLLTIVGTSTYLGSQAPYYQLGYGLGIACMASALITTSVYMYLARRENKRRDLIDVSEFTTDELEEMGDKAPTFRYML